ncbi:MAG: hypothetical protein C6I00_04660 [Nitratiruptor sp.]|nr:hypothetical protein [Nitratiruptor sp.]NPA84200.1 HlyD family efflux transporter periplasmic adaptor subunit [Campylobacterota bacterium]
MDRALLLLVLILVLLGGCAKSPEEKEIKKSKEGITIRLEGEVFPSQVEEIIAPVDGTVKELYIDVGDRVRRGELLLRFETTVTRYDLERTQQELAYLQSLKEFFKGSKKERTTTAMVNIARMNLERLAKLKSQGYTSEQEFANAKMAYASSLHSKYAEAENKIERIRMLDERIATIENELKKLNHILALSEVRSGIDGIVSEVKTQKGDYVSKGAKLGTIANIDTVIVRAGIAPGLLPFIKRGKEVKVDFITTPPYSVKARISRVVLVVDPTFGRMTAEIEIPNKNYILQTGTKALVTVFLSKEEQEFIRKNFLDNPNKTVYEVKSKNF